TRIHDLAAEFGISSEQLLGMLKELDIFVRSHLSPLKPEQVALMRARWEREKRKLKDSPAPPKRRRVVKAAAEPVAAAPEARPKRRRRTAAEVAAAEAEAQAEAALEAGREMKSLVDQEAVAQNISRTLASIKGPVARKGVHRRDEGPSFRDIQEEKRREEKEREKTLVRVTEFITVSELANILKVPAKEIVAFAFKELGQMVTINQRLDFDMIELIASAFGFQAVREEEYVVGEGEQAPDDAQATLRARPPVVTVMGHVDHGKTSLLDYIRKTNVVAGEAGGITQHIGAYQVTLKDGRSITFLDTPGHEAFTAMRDRRAHGTVLEATLDPGKGPVATILVQNGTLRVGDDFICGQFSGRVRAMYNERGETVAEAGPSTPVQILGFEGVPEAGDTFSVMADAGAAREIAQKRQRLEREAQHRRTGRVKTLEDFMAERAAGGAAALRIIIKADQGGPAEALADALAQLSTPEVKVEVVHRGVGAITDGDVLLAKASGAIIVGFHVRPD